MPKVDINVCQENIATLHKILRFYPKNFQLYADIGFIKLALGEVKDAIEKFNQAIALNYDHSSALYGRAHAKMALGKFESASADYEKVTALLSDFTEAHYHFGVAELVANKLEQALTHFNKVIEINPKHVNALYARSYLKFKLGLEDTALTDHATAWDLDKNAKNGMDYPTGIKDIFTQIELGKYQAEQGNLNLKNLYVQEAVHHVQFSVEERYAKELEKIESLMKQMAQGNQLLLNKKYTEALEYFDAVLKETPYNFEALYRKANILEELGNVSEAVAGYKKITLLCTNLEDELFYQQEAATAKKRLGGSPSSSPSFSPTLGRVMGLFAKPTTATSMQSAKEPELKIIKNASY